MLVTCSIGCTSHRSLILYIVAINIYNITRSNQGTGDPLQLLTGSDVRAKNFKENICAYNHAFAFTSLGVKEDHSINQGNGPPVFRIQGELAHWSGTLLPETGHSPVYAQLYIYDPSTAVGYRMANNNGSALRHDTMEI